MLLPAHLTQTPAPARSPGLEQWPRRLPLFARSPGLEQGVVVEPDGVGAGAGADGDHADLDLAGGPGGVDGLEVLPALAVGAEGRADLSPLALEAEVI